MYPESYASHIKIGKQFSRKKEEENCVEEKLEILFGGKGFVPAGPKSKSMITYLNYFPSKSFEINYGKKTGTGFVP